LVPSPHERRSPRPLLGLESSGPREKSGSGRSIVHLGTFGGIWSVARGINDHGHVVGDSPLESGLSQAFLWKNGTMTDLGVATRSVAMTMPSRLTWVRPALPASSRTRCR